MDYFNQNERNKQNEFSKFRDKTLSAPISILIRVGVTPNFISIIGVVFLIISALIPPKLSLLFPLFCMLYIIMDGIDGPLARATNRAHDGGSIVDIVADQLGIVVLSASAIWHIGVQGVFALIFSTSYITFIVFVIFTSEKKIAIPSFFRSKYMFYVFYYFGLIGFIDTVNIFMIVFGVYYWIMSFVTLRLIYYYYDGLLDKNT